MNNAELLAAAHSPAYFTHHCVHVYDATSRAWLPFHLWPAQSTALRQFATHRLNIVLKARQLGLSWLVLAYALWLLIFRPGSVILLFSRRDDEAAELLDRLRGMLARLPPAIAVKTAADNAHELRLANGSRAMSFPTTKQSARSYTASLVIVDEADFIPHLAHLMAAVKPTIDAGGSLILVSTVNKDEPESEFRRIWRTATSLEPSGYRALFLPWSARPSRTPEWYAEQARDYDQDTLWQEYPASITEALAPRQAAGRFAPAWLTAATRSAPAGQVHLPDLASPAALYAAPIPGRRYVIGADPAEGSPTSDFSAATLLDATTWAEVAHLCGHFEPDIFAAHLAALARAYNGATICCERNNHGHAVHVALRAIGAEPLIYQNPHDGKEGWLSNLKYKTLAVDNAAQALRDGSTAITTPATLAQLAEFRADTLAAPRGHHDDRAMSLIIALAALRWPGTPDAADALIRGGDPLHERPRTRERGFS